MKLLPMSKLRLHLAMAPGVAAETLDANCEEWSPAYSFCGKKTKPFIGSLNGYSFKMYRAIGYTNSFLPILVGNIDSKDEDSLVQIRMRMPLWTSAFMVLWFSFLAWALFLDPPTLDEPNSRLSAGLILFGYIFMQLAFWLEVPKAEQGIREVFANES
jgi:hypothetical protein